MTEAACWFCGIAAAEGAKLASGRPLAREEGRETPFICDKCASAVGDEATAVGACSFCGREGPVHASELNPVRICAECARTAHRVLTAS